MTQIRVVGSLSLTPPFPPVRLFWCTVHMALATAASHDPSLAQALLLGHGKKRLGATSLMLHSKVCQEQPASLKEHQIHGSLSIDIKGHEPEMRKL